MKRLALGLITFALSWNVASAAGLWRVTPVVDSRWAGVVQMKWNSATGESYHSTGYGGSWNDWLNALGHLTWTRIQAPAPDWEPGPTVEGRFMILPQIAFGNESSEATKRTAVFMLDTYSGATYVAAMGYLTPPDGEAKNFLYHDVVRGARWVHIEEQSVPPVSEVGRYEISAVNSTVSLGTQGVLGPYLMRVDRVTGQAEVAIFKSLFPSTPDADAVHFIWCPIWNTDPGASSPTTPSSSCPLN